VKTWNEFAIEWTDRVTGEVILTHFRRDRRGAQAFLIGRPKDTARLVTRTMSEGDWEQLHDVEL
jgi:hypothetical protein